MQRVEQERKLLGAYYADQVSPPLFAEEQARIKREREQAEGILSRLTLQFDDIEQNLELALRLLADPQRSYLAVSTRTFGAL